MDVQFTSHAIERVTGRLAQCVNYGEVQSALTAKQPQCGEQRLLVKQLNHTVTLEEKNGHGVIDRIVGNKIYALCTVTHDGITVKTVALSF